MVQDELIYLEPLQTLINKRFFPYQFKFKIDFYSIYYFL